MKRRLCGILRLVLLVLWLVVLGIWVSTWVRGRPQESTFMRGSGESSAHYTIRLSPRQLFLGCFQRQQAIIGPQNSTPAVAQWAAQFGPVQQFRLPGIEYGREPVIAIVVGGKVAMAGMSTRLSIASWLLLLLISLPILLEAIISLRNRRQSMRCRRGLCLTCGYDLRASKERCPECGTAIPAESVAGCEAKAI